ncbi:MAG: hypothetical protein FJ104_15300 [Deltaproteobacteria bacterium]|nr:hypothetical protein [Deltaproteobacteria bacterium]
MDPARFLRVLMSLADGALRVGYAAAELAALPADAAATLIDAIAEGSETSDPDAREALLTVVLVLVDPARGEWVDGLRELGETRGLLSLGRLLRRGPTPGSIAPPPDELRVPDYGKGRELSLGERRALARRPDRAAFERLCLDPHPLVIRNLLGNPKMVEDDALRIATLRPARAPALRELARTHRWMSRPRVRMSILLNPGAPPGLAIPLVALCTREDLRDIVRSTETSLALRGTAQELLARRPPLLPEDPGWVH